MALLFDARLRAIDANGNPLTGATLTINNANTATPTAIFSDTGLTVPMANPVAGASASDAGGWFPQIFAAEGIGVDITLKNSLGATVQTWVDVTFVGADTGGEFERTLSDSTRFKVRGALSVVYIEFGDPSPDNTGGTAVIGGWAGTQADLLTINSTLFNVVGRFKENGKELLGVVYVEATNFASVDHLDIALPNDPSGTIAWDIDLWGVSGLISSNNVNARFSYDGGLTYKSGASDYDTVLLVFAAAYSRGAATDTSLQLSSNATSPANQLGQMTARVITVTAGSDGTTLSGRFDAHDNAGTPAAASWLFSGVGRGGYGRATHIRIYGTNVGFLMSGKYRVTALRGFGES